MQNVVGFQRRVLRHRGLMGVGNSSADKETGVVRLPLS